MILAKLKEATKLQHQQLETTVDVMDQMLNAEDYEKLLRRFYGFYAAVEPPILRVFQKENIDFDYDARLKIPLLTRDLRFLNGADFDINTLEICLDAPPFETFAQTLGGAYVLEGATLGGQIIGRHLRDNLQFLPASGAAFFNSYGENVGKMWKAFGAMATAAAETLDKDDEITASARNTFTKFDKWLGHSISS